MAQARLTPLAKGLIAVIIILAATAAAWQFGLKGLFAGGEEQADNGGGDGSSSGPAATGEGPLGSATNPLKVSIVSFHGYAPALVANGSNLRTQPGSIFARQGVNVEFVIQDDIPTLATIFESGAAHCSWRTSDFWAQEQPNLRNNNLDARAIMVVDNTRGADAVIARASEMQRIEDLAGKRIALLQYTPSHGMVIDAIDNSSLTARRKQSVDYVYVNADEGTAGVRAAFQSGQVDAAALWDPDLSLALEAVEGAHVIYSTRTATNLIYDVIVCDKRVLDARENEAALQSFVAGWMEGVEAAEADHDAAVNALVETQEFFSLLAQDEGRAFVKRLFGNLVWTGLDENARALGLAGGTNHYERVYQRFDGIYRRLGALANPNSPVIPPQDSFDYRFIRALMAEQPQVEQAAAQPEHTFTEEEAQAVREAAPAQVTKPVTVNFATGSSELTRRAQQTIDTEMVPLIENNGAAYFEISGNTDSTGARSTNMRLSERRAQAVKEYLVTQWEFPTERFMVVGNGPDEPICDEANPESEDVDLEGCRAMNRTTRLAVLSRSADVN